MCVVLGFYAYCCMLLLYVLVYRSPPWSLGAVWYNLSITSTSTSTSTSISISISTSIA